MQALRLGQAVRRVRQRRGLRQEDLARMAGVSQSAVSRFERGLIDTMQLQDIEAICRALEVRVDVVPRWRGGDLERLLNAAHSMMHDAFASWFGRRHGDWLPAPEVSFAVYGERGVIDILAWHAPTRTLLVIELKTALVDLNDLVGTVDRKRRLAALVARERGWDPVNVGVWVVVSSSRTNRRHAADHRAFLRSAFPADGRAVRRWLDDPDGPIAALSLETFGAGDRVSRTRAKRRIRRPVAAARAAV